MFLTLTHSSEYSVLFVASLKLHHKHFWPFLSFSGVTVLLTLMLLTLEPMTTVILSITSTNISLFPPWKTHTDQMIRSQDMKSSVFFPGSFQSSWDQTIYWNLTVSFKPPNLLVKRSKSVPIKTDLTELLLTHISVNDDCLTLGFRRSECWFNLRLKLISSSSWKNERISTFLHQKQKHVYEYRSPSFFEACLSKR